MRQLSRQSLSVSWGEVSWAVTQFDHISKVKNIDDDEKKEIDIL